MSDEQTTVTEQTVTEPAAEPTATEQQPVVEPAAEPAPKKWTLKAGDKVVEIDKEDELVRRAQLGLGAERKMEQAHKLVEALKADPLGTIRQLDPNFDVDGYVERALMAKLELAAQTPEQRAAAEALARAEAAEAELKRREQLILESKIAETQQKIEADIVAAIDATDAVPQTPQAYARVVNYLQQAVAEGGVIGRDFTVDQVVQLVARDYAEELAALAKRNPGRISEVLPEDVRRKISAAEAKAVAAAMAAGTPGPQAHDGEQPTRRLRMREVFG